MEAMNKTRFRQLVVGEKFRLPGSDVLMVKDTLREEPGLGWVNATYDIADQERPCHINDEAQVVRSRSSQGVELRQSGFKTEFEDTKR